MSLLPSNLRRLARITGVLARHALAHRLGERLERWPRLARRLPPAGLTGPQRLRRVLEELGGSFIKLGQMLALQPDILSRAYCDALLELLDRVEPFGFEWVERTFREELGRGPEEVFDRIDRRPLATASVGQVHVAVLGGRKVAVKVQRPNARRELMGDVQLLVAAVRIIGRLRLKPLAWAVAPITEFVEWTGEELDYRNEARHADRLRAQASGAAAGSDQPSQYIPAVVAELTTRRTLVVELLEGVSLLAYLRAREQGDEVLLHRLALQGFDRRRFAANVLDNFLGQAFRHGIYHADLHPANLIILADSTVGYIDFGITGMMSRYSRRHLIAMTLALVQGDMPQLYAQFLKLSAWGAESDLPGFRAGLDRLAAEWYEAAGGARRLGVSFTRVMTDMLTLSRATNVMPERDIIKYIRSAIAIDGLNTRFEPDFHIGQHLAAACARHVSRQGLAAALSLEHLAALSAAGARLLTAGAARSGSLLERVIAGDLPVRARLDRGALRRSRALALQMAVAAFLFALLARSSPRPAALGWNLFTAEAMLAVAGCVLLVSALRRPV